jgi:hypothetical protein
LDGGINPSEGHYLHTDQHTQNKRTKRFKTLVEFEPTISVFERAKAVRAIDRGVTVIGTGNTTRAK